MEWRPSSDPSDSESARAASGEAAARESYQVVGAWLGVVGRGWAWLGKQPLTVELKGISWGDTPAISSVSHVSASAA